MIKKYIKLSLISLSIFLSPALAFAFPFWANTIQAVTVTSGIGVPGGNRIESYIIPFICLVLIISCEALFLKKRYFKKTNSFKIIEVVSVANLISTILGGIFLFLWNASVSCSAEQLYFFGPLYGIMEYLFPISPLIAMFGLIFFLVLYNVFFCIFSYFIERFIAQKYLQNTYSREVISKGILRANILSYTVFFFLTYVIFYSFGGILLPFNTSDTFSAEYSDTF
jgi:small-conductance mechanosensitive channel